MFIQFRQMVDSFVTGVKNTYSWRMLKFCLKKPHLFVEALENAQWY